MTKTENFVSRANAVHRNAYDYSKVLYTRNDVRVEILCSTHGSFWQKPSFHLLGQGCFTCGHNKSNKNRSGTKESFLDRASQVHKANLYTYEKVMYKNGRTPILITCKNHGDFEQLPNQHLLGKGCPKCRASKGELKIDEFLRASEFRYVRQFKFQDCKNLRPLPFDFAILNNDGNPIGIVEYQGEHHFKPITIWGGNENHESVSRNDIIKRKYCLLNQLPLLEISYQDKNKIIEKLSKFVESLCLHQA